MAKSKLTIRVHDTNKINTIAEWCKANLAEHEWDMTAINLINPPDYKFHFELTYFVFVHHYLKILLILHRLLL